MLMTENAFYPLFLVVALLLVLTLERPTPARQLSLLVLCGDRVRDPRAGGGARRCRRDRARCSSLRSSGRGCGARCGASRSSTACSPQPSSSSCSRPRRAASRPCRCSAPTGPRRRAATRSAASCTTCSTTWPSSTSISASCRSRRCSRSGSRRAARRRRCARSRRHRSRSRPGSCSRSRPSPRRASWPGSRNGTSSTSRRSRWSRCSASPRTASCPGGGASSWSPRPSPACCPSSSRSPASSRRARSRTPSRCCPGGGSQDHLFRSRTCASRRSPSASLAAAVFAFLPRRFALVLPLLVAAYFVGDELRRRERSPRHPPRERQLPVRRDAPDASGLDRPRRRPGCLGRRPLGREDDAVHGLGERVLQPQRRSAVRPRRRRPGPARADAGARAARTACWSPRGLTAAPCGRSRSTLLADSSLDLAGTVVARDPVGVDLYRSTARSSCSTHVVGLYPNDTWSGTTVTYRRFDCHGGRSRSTSQSDPGLFDRPQTVTAHVGGRVVASVVDPADGRRVRTSRRRSRRAPNGRARSSSRWDAPCSGDGRIRRPGRSIARPLGAHFLAFTYHP